MALALVSFHVKEKPFVSSLLAIYGGRRRLSTRVKSVGRRSSLISILVASTASLPQLDDSKNTLLQKYLKKSKENKIKNDKERLDSYYKRNYKDYFDFVEGTLRAKNEELSESEKGILEWLQTNK
eukprot:TRINITY_DN26695_c0_g1_i1.p1 TRINITY_DN26695_c0_g1~~TRINITY_DN26695_c0_g1_i1.p1  ORF type:complete len:125 (-),score=24.88 TRINITY_DN26695_c0_g1_i1:156-530(-)